MRVQRRGRGGGEEGRGGRRKEGLRSEDSRFNAQREVLTHGYRGFEVLLALFANQLSS